MSAREAFSVFDADGSGSITVDELREVLMMGGSTLRREEVEAIMSEVDVNGDGELQVEEFEAMWKLFTAGAGDRSAAPPPRAGGAARRRPPSSAPPSGRPPPPPPSSSSVSASRDSRESRSSTRRSSRSELTAAPATAEYGYEEPEGDVEGEWLASKWLSALGVSKVITAALKVPPRHQMPAFEYVRKLKRTDVERLMAEASLSGLVDLLMEGIEQLSRQQVASSAALNDKFQASGKFQMSCAQASRPAAAAAVVRLAAVLRRARARLTCRRLALALLWWAGVPARPAADAQGP